MLQPCSTVRCRRRVLGRHGSSVVELAVCLPAIVVLVLGAIEACTAIFVKQSLHIAAYEAVRTAIDHRAFDAAAEEHAQRILDQRHVRGSEIELIPANVDNVERGDEITVRITAPIRENVMTHLGIFRGNLTAEATMVKE